jgi:hypothetical protein
VAHLAGADPEGEGAEGAVRGGVTVAAGDGHARLGQAQLGADHVDDALPPAVEVEQRHPGVPAVPHEVHRHLLGQRVAERTVLGGGRHDVVHGGERPLGVPDPQARLPQHLERLGRRHLVYQVEADEELGLPRGQDPDRVGTPDLVEQ